MSIELWGLIGATVVLAIHILVFLVVRRIIDRSSVNEQSSDQERIG